MGMEVLIGNMNTLGFYDFFLPFLLFVAIIFGLLQKNKVFGEKETVGIDAVISMCVSFFVINYTPIGLYFSTLFAIGASIIGAMLVGVIILGMAGIDAGKYFNTGGTPNGKAAIVIAGAGIVVVALFIYASGIYDKVKGWIPAIGEDTIITLIALVFIIVVFAAITGLGKSTGGSGS